MRLAGLIAATFTPMNPDGSLSLEKIPAVTDSVIKQGANGLFTCGSTGESPSLTTAERMAVSASYSLANAGRVPLIVHVGHNSLSDARELAVHAQEIGADAIAIVPPSYFPLDSVQKIVDVIAAVSAAAPSLPIYYYHIPRLTGVGVNMRDLLTAADEQLPQLAGIKFSSFELDDLIACVHHRDRHYNILFGSDEMLLAGLVMGAEGAVGSTFNFLGPQYRAVIDAFQSGDIAGAEMCQFKVTQLVHVMLRYGGHNAIKAAMGIYGEDCGPPRIPLHPLSEEQLRSLADDLRGGGV